MGLTTADLGPFGKKQIDDEFKRAAAHTGSGSDEIRLARALMDVGAVEAYPVNVALALSAAARLDEQSITPSCVRRNYPMGRQTHAFVREVVSAAERAMR